MADRRHVIIKVADPSFSNSGYVLTLLGDQVFRKYGHSLGPESLEFLEDLLDRHDIADEDVEYSIEWMAKEYNKQDGMRLTLLTMIW